MNTPRKPLTHKQQTFLAYIIVFHSQEDRIPSSHELAEIMGFASQTASIGHLRALCKKGYLEHRKSDTGNRAWYRFPRNDTAQATQEGANSTQTD